MTTDYANILKENKLRYGTDIGRIGPMLLAERYADRTHFIYELLQNAEDALARRKDWQGSRAVQFELTKTALRVAHCGMPFSSDDVKGICGIAESTKSINSIGRFGIGFKSVYAFTECPEIHSGDEHFSIGSFVWPLAIPPLGGVDSLTIFNLPLRSNDASAYDEISNGLCKLGGRTLLFLREIEEISWSVENGPSGLYLRDKPEPFGISGRKVTVIGQMQGLPEISDETWLIFSREVKTQDGRHVGHVEIAFELSKQNNDSKSTIIPVTDSTLVVFFPTIVPTNFGLLVQGPYRTTPSRDNVPRNDPWNQYLIKETSSLIIETLRELRENELLDANTLRCLPIDRTKYPEGNMFYPLFEAVRNALTTESFLPCFGNGHTTARNARLGRTQEIRDLFDPRQLAQIHNEKSEIFWLSEDITRDRMAELRRYLMLELGIIEMTSEMLIPKLTKVFLEAQTDTWVVKLYEFLNGQPSLQRQLDNIPIVRLEDGTHVKAKKNGQVQAFLPSSIDTSFPTVRRTVCISVESRKLLESLGLREPDPVDDVIRNILPKYANVTALIDDKNYSADIQKILQAFATDSKLQREKLIDALRKIGFIKAVETEKGTKTLTKPGDVYLATQRLKDLFDGVPNVLLVDDTYDVLKGENIRELLEACGATRYLQPVPFVPRFTLEEQKEMRRRGGCVDCTYNEGIEDYTLRGLVELLDIMQTLDMEKAKIKAGLLWDALHDVEDRRGTSVFTATYRWKYFWSRDYKFDAAFLRILNETPWIPAKNKLDSPPYILFEDTGWKQHPFLLSKIKFKPPIIETLAREAGFEPGVLDLLKKLGVTSEAELKTRLGIKDDEGSSRDESSEENLSPGEALRKLGIPPATPPASDANEPSQTSKEDGPKVGQPAGHTGGSSAARHQTSGANYTGTTSHGGHRQSAGTSSGTSRPFISYVGVHKDDHEPDPDGLTQEARIALEERAIEVILQKEPQLSRTPTNNPGFDLIETNSVNMPLRWIEVKAMSKDLYSRPVGMSRIQFNCAREHGIHYWLYIVEHADDHESARIVKIQDPAGKACTFTFDHGWRSVAEMDDLQTPSEKDTGEENED